MSNKISFIVVLCFLSCAFAQLKACDRRHLRQCVDALADSVQTNTTPKGKSVKWVTLLAGDYDYREPLLNAVIAMRRVYLTNPAILCFDTDIANYLSKFGVKCVILQGAQFFPTRRERINWIFHIRHVIAMALLHDGISVLMSDVDAVIVHDPWPLIAGEIDEGSNLIVSRGKAPQLVYVSLGTTWCMGVYFVLAGRDGELLQTAVGRMTKGKKEADQKYANAALFKWGLRSEGVPAFNENKVKWLTKKEQPEKKKQHLKYLDSTEIARVQLIAETEFDDAPLNLQISFLPHSIVPRMCENRPHHVKTATIVHCQSPHHGSDKIKELRDIGAWYLPSNYMQNMLGNFEKWYNSLQLVTPTT